MNTLAYATVLCSIFFTSHEENTFLMLEWNFGVAIGNFELDCDSPTFNLFV